MQAGSVFVLFPRIYKGGTLWTWVMACSMYFVREVCGSAGSLRLRAEGHRFQPHGWQTNQAIVWPFSKALPPHCFGGTG